MDPILRAILLSWTWRLEVIVPLLLLGLLYTRGWWRLRQRTAVSRQRLERGHQLTAGWRLASYWGGLAFIALALLSPIDVLSGQLFFMHMIQHLLLIMFAPPLLLIVNPMPVLLWGLPDRLRLVVGGGLSRLLHRESRFRSGLRAVTVPGAVWLIWITSLVAWHDPTLYDAALRYQWLHDVEHLTFFGGGMLYWWLVTGAGPRVHKQMSLTGRIAFSLSAVPPNMLLGIVLSFANEPYYSHYLAVPRLWGLDVLSDQQLGGVIMWVPGSMMYLIATLVLVARLLQGEDRKPVLSVAEWGSDAKMAAPGIGKDK
jgi:putative membrane protein